MKSKELIQEYIQECDKYGWCEYEGKYWKPELQIILKDLEILEIFKKILKENHNAQRIDNCVYAKSDTETFFGLEDDTIIVENKDIEKIEYWLEED